mmetsp:Transcript_20397/g.31852  ORF Transcript_20397/g.31852 Transcript_20397/m.31852 type:complete len:93 (-) Transcript_20397:499-777(-)
MQHPLDSVMSFSALLRCRLTSAGDLSKLLKRWKFVDFGGNKIETLRFSVEAQSGRHVLKVDTNKFHLSSIYENLPDSLLDLAEDRIDRLSEW